MTSQIIYIKKCFLIYTYVHVKHIIDIKYHKIIIMQLYCIVIAFVVALLTPIYLQDIVCIIYLSCWNRLVALHYFSGKRMQTLRSYSIVLWDCRCYLCIYTFGLECSILLLLTFIKNCVQRLICFAVCHIRP